MNFRRVLAGACLGAIAGAVALVVAASVSASLRIDVGLSRAVRGAYDREFADGEEYAWTSRDVTVDLPGLDRHAAWTCAVQLRGARADPATLPLVTAAVDGVTRATLASANEYQTLSFDVPAAVRPGAILTLSSSNTFAPGSGDHRALGVRVQNWNCSTAAAIVRPPRVALLSAAAAAALFGVALGVAGVGYVPLVAGVALVAVGQAAVVTQGLGAFAPYAARLPWLALWIVLVLSAALEGIRRLTAVRLSTSGAIVLAFSACALYLQLLGLFHPSKPMGDALFHAHRLEWVLGGRFFFTQPLASGLEFPYAIALYVIAAPWTLLATDHVALLRVVVIASQALAGMLLYMMASRIWGDRIAGVVAVVTFALVPLSYEVVGYGLLTNAFARSAALAAVGVATLLTFNSHRAWRIAALACVTAVALLSHVSVFALLSATLVAEAGLFWLYGNADARDSAVPVLTATIAAAVVAVVLYYGHFGQVFLMVVKPPSERAATGMAGRTVSEAAREQGVTVETPSLATRTTDALRSTGTSVGWPILALALIGAWRMWREGARDKLAIVTVAWGLAYLAFIVVGVAAPVDEQNKRFAGEFVGRVVYATCPAAVLLAGRGFSWSWGSGLLTRFAGIALLLCALFVGASAWLHWAG